ncbi:hypothetical protein GJ654_13460 [Rhodoblastus acidophilus]|uniref:Hydrophobic W protein n=1 Tax=Rhodoblastus acidophilus TaxID=1074 RepID=A0A6N8DT28_RHOAC|nr:hypothetical protein [Rhodoblastus acidophilus]MCW2275449.1 hypothetical protein [Rhodoblastus acidophilus]MTV31994.1 hypothetical protein [Rhodoblastus acidophilus]
MSQSENKGERVVTIPVAPGIFVLRYVAAGACVPPHLFLRTSPASENSVALIFAPGAEAGVLAAPGAYALVVAERSGRIQLTIVGAPGEDDGAEIKIEPLGKVIEAASLSVVAAVEKAREETRQREQTQPCIEIAAPPRAEPSGRRGRPPAVSSAAGVGLAKPTRSGIVVARGAGQGAAAELSPELDAAGFGVVCHVSRKGDVGATGGGWIGGPGSPAVIEGVTLHWNAPAGEKLEYQALAAGAAGRWSEWTPAGAFAGTRGRSLPLVGLRVRIAGGAGRFRLQGEAIFLGLPAVVDSGESLEFSSYAGVDPLVGLRLQLVPVASAATNERPADSPGPEMKKPATGLRVFKPMRAEERAV